MALSSLQPWERMPALSRIRMTAGEFFGCTASPLGWTDTGALEALEELRLRFGAPFACSGLFRRAWESVPGELDSARRCGTAFVLGEDLETAQRSELRALALAGGLFSRVCPAFNSGERVYVAKLPNREYGAAVFALQDELIRLGNRDVALTGCMDAATRNALKRIDSVPAWGEKRDVLTPLTSSLFGGRMKP